MGASSEAGSSTIAFVVSVTVEQLDLPGYNDASPVIIMVILHQPHLSKTLNSPKKLPKLFIPQSSSG